MKAIRENSWVVAMVVNGSHVKVRVMLIGPSGWVGVVLMNTIHAYDLYQ